MVYFALQTVVSNSASFFLPQTFPGLEQYAIKKFAEALETFPKVLAETSGVKGNEVISQLYASHNDGKKNTGFDIEVSFIL